MALDMKNLRALQPPAALGFKIRRLGHVVLQGIRTLDAAVVNLVVGRDTTTQK